MKKISIILCLVVFMMSIINACVDLENPSTFTNNIEEIEGMFLVTGDIELCEKTYEISPSKNPLSEHNESTVILIVGDNIEFNCNGAHFEGGNTNNENAYSRAIDIWSSDNVTVRNCEIENYVIGIHAGDSWGSKSKAVTNSHFVNNKIYDVRSAGIDIVYYSTGNTVRNNEIYDVGQFCISFFGQSNNGEVRNNFCDDSKDIGLRALDGPFEIVNNIFCDAKNYNIFTFGHRDSYGQSNTCDDTEKWNDNGFNACKFSCDGNTNNPTSTQQVPTVNNGKKDKDPVIITPEDRKLPNVPSVSNGKPKGQRVMDKEQIRNAVWEILKTKNKHLNNNNLNENLVINKTNRNVQKVLERIFAN